MFEGDEHHLSSHELTQLLWLATCHPGSARAVAHLVAACNGCWRPIEIDPEERGNLKEAHFDDASLGALVWRILGHSGLGLAAKLGHLLEGCPTCWRLAEPLFRPRGPSPDSEEAIHLVRRFEDQLRVQDSDMLSERQQAPRLLQRLLKESPARRALLVRNSPRYSSAALVEALAETSRRTAPKDLEEAQRLAELAVAVATRLNTQHYGPRIVEDLQALAHAFMGNTLRIAQDVEKAEASFLRAREHQARGTGLAPVAAEIDSLEASLWTLQGHHSKARRLLVATHAVYRDLGEERKLARVLVKAAKISREAGEPAEACKLVAEALPKIDAEAEPRLLFCAQQNHLVSLIDLGRFLEADRLLPAVRELVENLGNGFDSLHVRWAEAEIAAGRGSVVRAKASYQAVCEELREKGFWVDLGLASLQLAQVHVNAGQSDRAQPLLQEAHRLLVRQGIRIEAAKAWKLLDDYSPPDA